MSGIDLLISDVDGTLLTPHGAITSRACDAIDRLRFAGVELALISGRPPRGLRMLTDRLAISTPIASFNGGVFVEPDLETVVEERTLPLAVSVEVTALLLDAGLDMWVYRGVDWFVRSLAAPHVAHEQATVRFEPTVISDLEAVLPGAIKLVGVSDDQRLFARAEARLRRQVGAYASVSRSQRYYLDVTHVEANKGVAARTVARMLRVPLERVATIGDMPTDVMMFGVSGLSIAMGNASLEVQRCARQVTTSNEDEGFANAVEWLVLGGRQGAQEALGLPPGTRACLFDLDGVLTRTASLHAEAWKQIFDEYLSDLSRTAGSPFVPFDADRDYTRYVDGKLREDGVQSFLASRGVHLSEHQAHDLASRKDEIFRRLLAQRGVETYAGSVGYLRAVRGGGLRTSVVSASRHCREVLASAGLAELFDARIDGLVAAEERLAGKPAADTYLAAARALGVDPVQAAVFEDAIAGVEAGRAGHFGYVVGVDRAGQREALRRHGADIVVDDLAELLEVP